MTQTNTAATVRPYRQIPYGYGGCPECDEVVKLSRGRMNRYRQITRPTVLYVHGPRSNRCPGSRGPQAPWVEASGLPTWDDMTDLDKGAALLHVWKRSWEGVSYAREHYPAEYFDDPRLTALDRRDACRHAASVCGKDEEIQERLGAAEYDRLYHLALDADRQRMSERLAAYTAQSQTQEAAS